MTPHSETQYPHLLSPLDLGHTTLLAIMAVGALFPPRRIRADVEPETKGAAGGGAAAAGAAGAEDGQDGGKKEL